MAPVQGDAHSAERAEWYPASAPHEESVAHRVVRASASPLDVQAMLSRRARTAAAAAACLLAAVACVAWGSGARRGSRDVSLIESQLKAIAPRQIYVRVPPGLRPGEAFDFNTPDGAVMSIAAPPGVDSGDVIPVLLAVGSARASSELAASAPSLGATVQSLAEVPSSTMGRSAALAAQAQAPTAAPTSLTTGEMEVSVAVPSGILPGGGCWWLRAGKTTR